MAQSVIRAVDATFADTTDVHTGRTELRDTFAAVFFFAFGLTIDPGDIGAVAVPIVAAVLTAFALVDPETRPRR